MKKKQSKIEYVCFKETTSLHFSDNGANFTVCTINNYDELIIFGIICFF